MNQFSKFIFVVLGSVLLFTAVTFSKAAVSQLVLYDNFSSRAINPAKWTGWQFFDPDIGEAGWQLVGEDGNNRGLHLFLTAYSATSDDFGASGGAFGLTFPTPSAINEVAFTVVVDRATAVACASNSSLDGSTQSFAAISSTWTTPRPVKLATWSPTST